MTRPKTCHLILTHGNYDLIDKGFKFVEYRRASKYYLRRVLGATHVTFHRGYTKTTMTFEIENTKETVTQIEIHLGRRVR